MVEIDQRLRNAILKDIDNQELSAQLAEADGRHTERLCQIVDSYGWPGKSMVGENGAHAAWLLVQHADRAPDFQARCLKLMSAAGIGEVDVTDLAYLTDRVRVNAGQPQVYGTQFWTDENGKFGPRLLEDEYAVDERRTEVGLGPLAEYRQQMLKIYGESEKSESTAKH